MSDLTNARKFIEAAELLDEYSAERAACLSQTSELLNKARVAEATIARDRILRGVA